MTPNYLTTADTFDNWRDGVLTGERPPRWAVGADGFESVELGPGLVLLLGGAPGAGKTCLAMQWTLDALRLTPDLRALVANVETAPAALLDRQLARLSGIDLATLRDRSFSADWIAGGGGAERLDTGFEAIESIGDRLAFLTGPYNLANVAAAADDFDAQLLVLDYAQRFGAPGDHADKRSGVNALMDYLRRFAEAGIGVLVLAAVGRTKDRQGRSSYDADGLGLASFRESSELEFGCDSAYMLSRGSEPEEALLRCLKNRHSEPIDLRLAFNGSLQRFETLPRPFDDLPAGGATNNHQTALADLWGTTDAATDSEGGSP